MSIHPTDNGLLKRFRLNPLPYQETFATPLKDLDNFVATILETIGGVTSARLTIDKIIFEPKNLNSLLDLDISPKVSIEAQGGDEAGKLLRASLSDSVDFFFVPSPKHMLIYADHDEYCTFYAARKSPLSQLNERLKKAKLTAVHGYQREL